MNPNPTINSLMLQAADMQMDRPHHERMLRAELALRTGRLDSPTFVATVWQIACDFEIKMTGGFI